MGDFLTELGNSLFLIAAALGGWYSIRWRSSKLSLVSRNLITAWEMIFIAVGIRVGWWIFALKLSSENETYNQWFIDWKWAMTVPTSALFAVGMLVLFC